jgi:hypothetical protein
MPSKGALVIGFENNTIVDIYSRENRHGSGGYTRISYGLAHTLDAKARLGQ